MNDAGQRASPPARTLAAVLDAPPPPRDALALARDLLAAVAALHARGAVHGGLAPDRVLLDGDLALAAAPSAADPLGEGAAAIPFTAPEVLRGRRATRRADVFAAGALVRALLAGPPGAVADPLEAIRRGLHPAPGDGAPATLPAAVAQAVRAAVEPRWWLRPRSVRPLLKAIEAELATATRAPGSPSRGGKASSTFPSRRAAIAMGAAAALGVLAALALALHDGDRTLAGDVADRIAHRDLAGARALLDRADRAGRGRPLLEKLRGDLAFARGAPGECVRRYRVALAADPALRRDPTLRENARLLLRSDRCDARRAAAELLGELRDPAALPALREAKRTSGFLGFFCTGDALDRAILAIRSAPSG